MTVSLEGEEGEEEEEEEENEEGGGLTVSLEYGPTQIKCPLLTFLANSVLHFCSQKQLHKTIDSSQLL